MRVLFPASEITSIYQLGGLGDVARSLPLALKSLGVDIRLAMPYHASIIPDNTWTKQDEIIVTYAGKEEKTEIWKAAIPQTDLPVYLFANNPYLSAASGVADDAIEKFAFFSLAVCSWLINKQDSWQPDILHLNDWHTGLIPVLLKHRFNCHRYKTLLTIHNLNFQGIAFWDLLNRLEVEPTTCEVLRWDGQNTDINLLMEGIIHTDCVNAVSPTYAKEILTQEYGAYLDPVLNALSGKLIGILNGIDYQTWNPETDNDIVCRYTVDTLEDGKKQNKKAVQEQLNLPINPDAQLLSYIGRVDGKQKGIDLIIEAIQTGVIGTEHCHFVFLGTGDTWLEDKILELNRQNPFMKAICKFDSKLSHLLYAGSDAAVMPSRYEPCGLVQLIAMRYGTIPIARKTGGLADTILDGETGFLFDEYSPFAFCQTVRNTLITLHNTNTKLTLQHNCMAQDFSWKVSARKYRKLYYNLVWD